MVGRVPRAWSSSRMSRRRRIALLSLRFVHLRAPNFSMSLSVCVLGSMTSVNVTRVPPALGSSSYTPSVRMRLNLPVRPASTILRGRSTSMSVLSAHEKRLSGALIR